MKKLLMLSFFIFASHQTYGMEKDVKRQFKSLLENRVDQKWMKEFYQNNRNDCAALAIVATHFSFLYDGAERRGQIQTMLQSCQERKLKQGSYPSYQPPRAWGDPD